MRLVAVVLVSVVAVFGFAKCKRLPPDFPVCKRSDPDLNTCFTNAIITSLPLLKKSHPELQLPSIEPMEIESIAVTTGTSNVRINSALSKIKIYGLVDAKVDKSEAKIDDKSFTLTVNAVVPNMVVDADYEFNGQILQLPLVGKGPSHTVFDDVVIFITVSGDVIEKKGKKYLAMTDVRVQAEPTAVKFDFQNLFNGDKQLGAEMNKLLNENWKSIYPEVRGSYEEAVAAFARNIFSKVLQVPLDNLFLP